MADVLWRWGQRKPFNTVSSQWDERSDAQHWYMAKHSLLGHRLTTLHSSKPVVHLSGLTPQRQVCKASLYSQQGRTVQSRGVFPDPTGANHVTARHVLHEFPSLDFPSHCTHLCLHMGLLFFSRKKPGLEDKLEQRSPPGEVQPSKGRSPAQEALLRKPC